jgi:hypothetical protein
MISWLLRKILLAVLVVWGLCKLVPILPTVLFFITATWLWFKLLKREPLYKEKIVCSQVS